MPRNILIYLGLVLVFLGFVFPLVTVTVDTTPPEWQTDSYGNVAIFPRDNEIYSSVARIQAGVEDLESGVKSVTAVIDGTSYSLTLTIGTANSGVWIKNIPALGTGSHHVEYTAINNVEPALSNSYIGDFQVYTDLQGEWYINSQLIQDGSDHLYFSVTTLNFKFSKTSGVEDTSMVCTVDYAGSETGTLTLACTSAATWETSKTFTSGTYTMTLKADDGTNNITFSIVDLDLGTQISFDFSWLNWRNGLLVMGVGMIAYGFYRNRTKKEAT